MKVGDYFLEPVANESLRSEDLVRRTDALYLCCGAKSMRSIFNYLKNYGMTPEEIQQWENEIYTKIVMDEFKRQRAAGVKEYLLDKYEMDRLTKEQLKRILIENIDK